MSSPSLAVAAGALLLWSASATAQGCPAWITLCSGNGTERIENWDTLCIAPNGDVLVAGFTTSTNFCPRTTPRGRLGNQDGFVARLDPAGNVIWSTLLGGSGADGVRAILCEPNGDVLIAGFTNGPGPLAPTSCAFQAIHGGGPSFGDGFVARLTNAVAGPPSIAWLTYLGGSGDDSVTTLARDPNGRVIAAGWTASTDFPTAGAPFQPQHAPQTCGPVGIDAFVAVLDPAACGAAQLLCASYFGGDCDDLAVDVEIDAAGNIIVAGRTGSPNLPTTATAYATMPYGAVDVFVAQFPPTLTTLLHGSYLGGAGDDTLWDMVASPGGGILLAGETTSMDFPATAGAFQSTHAGGVIYSTDGFLAEYDPAQSGVATLRWSTYLGGNGDDLVAGVAVDSSGFVTAVGGTGSNPATPALAFPTTPGACTRVPPGGGGLPNGPFDAFVCRIDPRQTGTAQLLYSTYLGGSAHWDQATGVALTARGSAIVAGRTWSNDFAALSTTCAFAGGEEAFVAELDLLPTGVVRYGAPSPPCHGPLHLAVNGQPFPGNPNFQVHVHGAPPLALGALFLGAPALPSPGPGPIPVLGIDSWLQMPPPLSVLGLADARGFARFPLPVPAALSWPFGGLQAVWLGACAPLVASDALR